MSCSPFDLRDFFLQELPAPEQHQVEAHVKVCASCREELERLRLTEAALFSLRDEEIPQRIAFVSDPVFEPSRWRRWASAFWTSPARLGFASAAMLSTALLVSAFHRPAPPQPVMQTAARVPVVTTVPEAEIRQRVQAAVDEAVEKAVAASEARQAVKTRAVMAELEESRKRLLVAASELDYFQKQARLSVAANYIPKPLEGGDLK